MTGCCCVFLAACTMTIVSAKRSLSVFDRLGRGPLPQQRKTCFYWLEGRCTRNPCPYMHAAPLGAPKTKHLLSPRVKQQLSSNHLVPSNVDSCKCLSNKTLKNTDHKQSNNGIRCSPEQQPQEKPHRRLIRNTAAKVTKGPSSCDLPETHKEETILGKDDATKHTSSDFNEPPKEETVSSSIDDTEQKQCTSRVKGDSCVNSNKSETEDSCVTSNKSETEDSCVRSNKTGTEDSGVSGNNSGTSHGSVLIQLTKLKGHDKTITGIALPCGSSTLYTVSKDKCLRAWDCHTGQCTGTECLDGEVRCIISKGPWIFAGLPNNVKAWNPQDKIKCSLDAIGGQVHSLEFDNDILFAGTENGNIFVWRWNPVASDFDLAATLKGHSGPVHSLVIGSGHGKLYSVSTDFSIKVWDQTLQCIQTIDAHSEEVTPLVCWDRYLLSTSLDKTLKIWGAAESGSMEMIYKHEVDQGILSMAIMDQPEARHILLSLEDKSLRLYDFPSFVEKGRVHSEEPPVVSQAGVHGLFFTGDAAGDITVWKLCRLD